MKRSIALFLGLFLPFAASAAREGTPIWYQPQRSPVTGNQIVGQNVQTIQIPRPQPVQPTIFAPGGMMGTPTPAGIGFMQQPDWLVSAGYTRRFANFEFKTGVNSHLKWSDMIFDELSLRVDSNFAVRDMNLFAFGEYRRGTMSRGGFSIDYDLEPYDWSRPNVGIFTISVGGQSGNMDHLRIGFGARNAWNVAGWQFSPSIGYEIFKHNLQMHDHIYPNPAIYLPLLTDMGNYVFGDEFGNFHTVTPGTTPDPEWFQVCMSPEDIMVAMDNGNGTVVVDGGTLVTIPYQSQWGLIPWGVGPSQCVIIGGDGPIIIPGTTHIYNTTWSGLFLGLEIEKQMTFTDRLRFYFQVGMPHFYSEGTWPNRTDWQQNPSFIDTGSNGSYSYLAEMEYIFSVSERLQLSLRADTNFFHVGQIPGELYVAGFAYWLMDDHGQFILDANDFPILIVVDPHTIKIQDSLKYATWQSFGLHLGIRYAF
jgi:hypothetical protein